MDLSLFCTYYQSNLAVRTVPDDVLVPNEDICRLSDKIMMTTLW